MIMTRLLAHLVMMLMMVKKTEWVMEAEMKMISWLRAGPGWDCSLAEFSTLPSCLPSPAPDHHIHPSL